MYLNKRHIKLGLPIDECFSDNRTIEHARTYIDVLQQITIIVTSNALNNELQILVAL